MAELDLDGRRLLACLVSYLGDVVPGDPYTYFTYTEVHDKLLGLRLVGRNVGASLQKQGMNSLAEWTETTSKPKITGLIVKKETREPGKGYFGLLDGSALKKRERWHEEVRLSKDFDWSPYLEQSATDHRRTSPPPATQKASDLDVPPPRIHVTQYRILRDSEVARRVKTLHGYECQVCGHAMLLPDGSLYAEAHHIQPLGGAHNGLDVEENIVCVCPNHHAELDLGLWDIDVTSLRDAPGHTVGREYVRYHNEIIRSRWQ